MNKILRFTFVAAMALVSSLSFAQTTVTFTAGTDKAQVLGAATLEKDGVSIAIGKNGGDLSRTDHYRIYKDQNLTISSTAGNITKISFTCSIDRTEKDKGGANNLTTSTGTYTPSSDNTTGVWEGNSSSVVFKATPKQFRATKIEVTYAASGDFLAAPTISGTTDFTESATVTITAAEGATIYYTINGQDPDQREGKEYTAPFTISETTTVKAIAYKGGLESSIATQEFTKKEIKAASDIAAFNNLADKDETVLTLNDAKVLYSWTSLNGNNSTYIRDASGALCLYNAGLDLKAGQILNGTVNITRSSYNGTIQGAKNDKTSKTTFTVTDGEAPIANTIKPADAASHVSDLVQFTNVNIVNNSNRFYIVDGDNKVQVYNGFHISGYTVAAAENVDVKGILVKYQTTYEVYPIEVPVATGITEIKADKAVLDANAPMYNLAGQRVDKSFKGVVIQKGKKFLNK